MAVPRTALDKPAQSRLRMTRRRLGGFYVYAVDDTLLGHVEPAADFGGAYWRAPALPGHKYTSATEAAAALRAAVQAGQVTP